MKNSKDDFILFLDIDGVLRPDNGRDQIITESCLKILHRIINERKARVVITSTWKEAFTKKELERKLRLPVYAICNDLEDNYQDSSYRRYREVKAYLNQHAPGSNHWLALDDKRKHYPPKANVHFTIDKSVGLTEHDYRAINGIASKTSDSETTDKIKDLLGLSNREIQILIERSGGEVNGYITKIIRKEIENKSPIIDSGIDEGMAELESELRNMQLKR